jgi:hypothetical protein
MTTTIFVIVALAIVVIWVLYATRDDGVLRTSDGRAFTLVFEDDMNPDRPTHLRFENGDRQEI